MRERTLFERLREPLAEAGRRPEVDLGALEASIQGHLRRILNSRQGGSSAVPDYGIPDLSEVVRDCPETLASVEEAIQRSIEKYEPRLKDVSVRFTPSEDEILLLSFEITARLSVNDQEADVWFMTSIGPEGRVDVKG